MLSLFGVTDLFFLEGGISWGELLSLSPIFFREYIYIEPSAVHYAHHTMFSYFPFLQQLQVKIFSALFFLFQSNTFRSFLLS